GRGGRRAGAPGYCEGARVAGGLTTLPPGVPLDAPRARSSASQTRSGAAMRVAAAEAPPGAVWVIGNAPTALAELIAAPPADPALVVGLPVGFVGAADAKAALADSGLPCLTNRGERGGSAVAAAAVHALLYLR